ncbi:MAG: hypothetical protein E6K54_02410 [Gammaproteobacteria bacterium]|nr:MAG: hypothetical protein E6K54_02410 [Gammaproteobacteria bacterium]
MTTEILWITLPTNEEKALKKVLISSKNLPNLNINELIEKLEKDQGADWIKVLGEYNARPSVNNINTSEMLSRAKSVRGKFELRGYSQLKDREFKPHELLSLIILCYSNPNLIGPKLCKALNDQNEADIKKEMLENSARVGNRVVPWASNLCLLNYGLYANDTCIRLPVNVIDRVTRETIRDGLIVCKLDERNGFNETVNGPERAASEANEIAARVRRDQSGVDSYPASAFQSLQSLQSDEQGIAAEKSENPVRFALPPFPPQTHFPTQRHQLDNGFIVTPPEALKSDGTNNATSSNYASGLVVGSLALFHIAKNTPVAAIVRNIGKDLATVSKHVGSFFSKNTECAAQEQKTVLLSPTVKS